MREQKRQVAVVVVVALTSGPNSKLNLRVPTRAAPIATHALVLYANELKPAQTLAASLGKGFGVSIGLHFLEKPHGAHRAISETIQKCRLGEHVRECIPSAGGSLGTSVFVGPSTLFYRYKSRRTNHER